MNSRVAFVFASLFASAGTPAGAGAASRNARGSNVGVTHALAQTPTAAARIEVLVIEGSNGPNGIGRELQHLPQLARPPFSAYRQISLVSRATLPLGTAASNVPVPGGAAEIASAGRQENGRFHIHVQLTLEGRAHNIDIAAAPGDPFFTARSTGPNSALILGFIVRE